jgi:hypothetical protein
MKQLFILSFCLMSQLTTKAQNKLDFPKTSFKAAYMSSVTLPGFKIGMEYLNKTKLKLKQKSWGTKTISKERYWTLNLGLYHQPELHTNLYLLGEKQFRRQYGKGFFMDLAPGFGYSRAFLTEETYVLTKDGTVSKKTLTGNNYAMLSIGGAVGYDFSKMKKLPLKVYLKPSLFAILPYNSSKYIRPTYEIGLIYKFSKKIKKQLK